MTVSPISNDGSPAGLRTAEATNGFDYQRFFLNMAESERLQVARSEVSWFNTYAVPDRTAEVVLSFGCGHQTVPHLMLTQVALFEALGVDFVATAGQAYCCGSVFQRSDKPATGTRVARTSIRRFASWQPRLNVHCCGQCYFQFSQHLADLEAETGEAPFGIEHVTRFLRDTLRARGGAVPWKREVRRRVLLDAHDEDDSPLNSFQREAVIETLRMIPGIEYVGSVKDPSIGRPCAPAALAKSADDDGTERAVQPVYVRDGLVNGHKLKTLGDASKNALEDITDDQYRHAQEELYEYAASVGADTIVTRHHRCHREWSKFGSERLPVMHYQSLMAEALGISIPDRFQILWRTGDPAQILEMTRPQWESWGTSEPKAKEMVRKFFVPKYAAAVEHCPCEGNCFQATFDPTVTIRSSRPAPAVP